MKRRLILFLSMIMTLMLLTTGCNLINEIIGDSDVTVMTTADLTGTLSPSTQAQETTAKPAETTITTTETVTTQVETTQAVTLPEETAPVETTPEPTEPEVTEPETTVKATEPAVKEDGEYSSKEEVALYIHIYGKLPSNFITKKQAQKLGWVSSEGNMWTVAPGKSIGGDYFGNYEELLPVKKGREYHECDIDFDGGYRGAKRIIYSNDGLIYYTEDHYESFTLLYGEE